MSNLKFDNYFSSISVEERRTIEREFKIIEEINQFPTLAHQKTGLEFKYIKGGTFLMGFSKKEEKFAKKIHDPIQANIQEMRPVYQVPVESFLISKTPLLNGFVSKFLDMPKAQNKDQYPAFLTREEAESLAMRLKMRLPLEKEWEYACRGGTDTLFFFGDCLPENQELEKFLSWNLGDLTNLLPNPFGLYGVFVGEWCQDEYKVNYEDNAPVELGSYVIRGGGAIFWPWQAQEWVWCMSAMRMPSKNLFDDRRCGLRLVFELNTSSP